MRFFSNIKAIPLQDTCTHAHSTSQHLFNATRVKKINSFKANRFLKKFLKSF
uniref:Macaca fascicularis brain cDNA, clone: QbsA-10911 n=1 Tax=Macaca fascicularis TaxID=9541 RepID=I7G3Y9_MACFA|nr:unnamed protein product [Macaca fascicularis]